MKNFIRAWKSPRWRWAICIAVVSDVLGFVVALSPPLQWGIDAITAVALVLALGFRWKLLGAMAIEVIPALQLFPAWTLVVLAMAATEKERSLPENNPKEKL